LNRQIADQWNDELQVRVKEFAAAGVENSEQVLKSIDEKRIAVSKELKELKDEIKKLSKEKKIAN